MSKLWWAAAAAITCALAFPAQANAERKVYLNGVDLGDVEVKSRQFKNATVRFDQSGNIHLTVPGFSISKRDADGKTPAKRPAKSSPPRRFLVITSHNGKTPRYAIRLIINGKRAVTVPTGRHTQVTDVTQYVRAGHNKLEIVADGPRDRAGPVAWSVTLGEGHVSKGRAVIAVPHVEYSFAPNTRGNQFRRVFTFRAPSK